MQKRTRVNRPPIPPEALTVAGLIPRANMPTNDHKRGGPRRWQELAAKIIAASSTGDALVVSLAKGYNGDVVRSGVKEELARHQKRLDWRSVPNEDGTNTLYLFARTPEES